MSDKTKESKPKKAKAMKLTPLERLNHEHKELKNRLTTLNKFIKTKAYPKLKPLARAHLRIQYKTMLEYLRILEVRINSNYW